MQQKTTAVWILNLDGRHLKMSWLAYMSNEMWHVCLRVVAPRPPAAKRLPRRSEELPELWHMPLRLAQRLADGLPVASGTLVLQVPSCHSRVYQKPKAAFSEIWFSEMEWQGLAERWARRLPGNSR
jgi:hypothetical protein